MLQNGNSVPFLQVHREINGYKFDPVGNDRVLVTYPNGTSREMMARTAMNTYNLQASLPSRVQQTQQQQQQELEETRLEGVSHNGLTPEEWEAQERTLAIERERSLFASLQLTYGDNRDYMPRLPDYDPIGASSARVRRDLSGHATFGGPVLDGQVVTLRNLAWGGTTVDHAWPVGEGTRVSATKNPNGDFTVSPVRMDNRYSWIIRKVTFSVEKRGWVMDPDGWKKQEPITKDDYVIFLEPNSPNMVLGTRKPPNVLATNSNYRVELVDFPLLRHLRTAAETVGTFFSLGFYSPENWVTQSRVIWTFSGVPSPRGELTYGSAPLHIQNEFTDAWSYGWGGDRPWDFKNKAEGRRVNKEYNGGRYLTQASNSDGETVKLAFENDPGDDKSRWIIDSWYGNHYPIPIVATVGTPTDEERQDSASPSNPNPGPTPIPENFTNPAVPPVAYGPDGKQLEMEWDPVAGIWHAKGLATATQGQNPYTWWDWVAQTVFGKDRWQDMTVIEQGEAMLLIAGGLLIVGVLVVKEAEHQIDKT